MSSSHPSNLFPKDAARSIQIEYLLRKLRKLSNHEAIQYAVEQSVDFFSAAQSVGTYITWLFMRSGKIDGNQLLEINELLPNLDDEMHTHLAEAGRREFPGFLRPIVDRIFQKVVASRDSRVRIIDIGSGSMEIERQVLEKLLGQSHSSQVTFIGTDISADALSRASANIAALKNSGIRIRLVERFDKETLEQIEHSEGTRFLVLLCRASVDELLDKYPRNYFSFAFTSLFLHHIPRARRLGLLHNIAKLAPEVFHFDGYRSRMNLIPQSIVAWQHPVFLNAVIFSNLRYMKKRELEKFHQDARLTFYPHGHYLSESLSIPRK